VVGLGSGVGGLGSGSGFGGPPLSRGGDCGRGIRSLKVGFPICHGSKRTSEALASVAALAQASVGASGGIFCSLHWP